MPRLQVRSRGLFPDISFGREPSNSTGGTFTHVASGFPGAHPKTAIEKFFQNGKPGFGRFASCVATTTRNAVFGLSQRSTRIVTNWKGLSSTITCRSVMAIIRP